MNDPPTGQQRELIFDAVPESDHYSPLLWLKLLEPGTDRVVRCRGWYDHSGGAWFAEDCEGDNGNDSVFLVSAIAWAPIVRG